ncbi:MAG: tetratricopeptide repeat protein [Candidatus Cloacimonetes bacterium]|jgi:tetratricopeptide (TPR) repeat protein|nr:tetratricopeptide repeat protein [Candidatus Cloacimonadota bacterium]
MDRARNHRRLAPLAIVAAVAAAAVTAAPAEAQDGGRYRVLVPALAPQAGAKDNFGKDVGKEVRKALDDFATHAPVEDKVLKDALKKFGLKEEDIRDCIKARQLAVQIGAELVMCGEYSESGNERQVTTKFVVPTTGEEFEVAPFAASQAKQAAAQIAGAFEQYLGQLRLAVFCNDELQRQAWDAAIEQCGKVVEANPNSAANQYNLASAYMNAGQDDVALATFEKAIEINPVHQEAILAAGVVAARLGQQEKSQRYLHQYLELNPGDQQVRLKIAADIAAAGDPRGALMLVEEGGTISTADADVTTLQYAGHFALAAAREAIENAGQNGNGDVSPDVQGLLEKALGYYNRAFDASTDEPDVTMLTNMLVAYRLLERFDEAIAFGERAIQRVPNDATLLSAYADALAAGGRKDQAVAMLNRVTQIDPQYAVNARLGSWQLEDGNLSAAQAAFRKALQNGEVASGDDLARPIFAQGYNNHHKNKRYDTAISYYNVAREFATSSATTGMINFFHGYALFQKALEMQKPSTAASARASLPVFQEAKRWLEQAGGYTEQAQQRQQLLQNVDQYIEIQNALIKRG